MRRETHGDKPVEILQRRLRILDREIAEHMRNWHVQFEKLETEASHNGRLVKTRLIFMSAAGIIQKGGHEV